MDVLYLVTQRTSHLSSKYSLLVAEWAARHRWSGESGKAVLGGRQFPARVGGGSEGDDSSRTPDRGWFAWRVTLKADIALCSRHVSKVPILLQKSFWGDERKFLEPLMRFTSGDVRDHIVSSKIDHGPPWWR
jgi:hypothetical protein